MNEGAPQECKRAIGDLLALIDIESKGFDGIDESFLGALRKAGDH